MRVSHNKGFANHGGPESCVDVREDIGEALTGESAGWVLSSEILKARDADAVMSRGRQHRPCDETETSTVVTLSQLLPSAFHAD